MHAQDEMTERIAIRLHVQGAGCQLEPVGEGHFWYPEPGRLGRGRALGGAVTYLHQSVIRHVEQITQLRLPRLPARCRSPDRWKIRTSSAVDGVALPRLTRVTAERSA